MRNNYDYKFGVDLDGSDEEECSNYYRGKSAFSEAESQGFKQYLESQMGKISAVINIESHQTFNGLIIPNNFVAAYNNQLLRTEDLSSYYFY